VVKHGDLPYGQPRLFLSEFLLESNAKIFIGNIWQDILPFLVDEIAKLLSNLWMVSFYFR